MKKKLIIAVCVVGIIIGILSVRAGISASRNGRENSESFIEGAKLVAYELREFLDTKDEESFHRAAIDVQSMAKDLEIDLGSEYNKKAFDSIVEAFTYSEGKLYNYAQRLAEAFEMISENPKDEYPYSQFNIVLNSIS